MALQDLPTNFVLCPSGTYCNSASACFVASDGKNLRLYQAVVDARKLLDELSDPDTSVSGHTLVTAHEINNVIAYWHVMISI